MNRKEFMERLEQLLADIPQEERVEALAYYNSYFEDAGPENEERIIRELESPEKVAKIIKADIGAEEEKEYTERGFEDTRFHQQKEVSARTRSWQENYAADKPRESNAWKIVLLVVVLILTCPVWIGLAGAAIGLIIGCVATVFGLMIAAAAVVFALYVTGFVLTGVGISMFPAGSFAAGISLMGSGFLVLALALLGTLLCVWMFGKFLPWLVGGIIRLCSSLFHRKGRMA